MRLLRKDEKAIQVWQQEVASHYLGCLLYTSKITEVVSADKTCTIQVTDGWKDLAGKLHPDASLEVADMSQEKYVIVLMEAKEDFVDMDLVGYTDIVVNQSA